MVWWLAWVSLVGAAWATDGAAGVPVVTIDSPPALAAAAAEVRGLDWHALAYDLSRAGLTLPSRLHVTLVAEDSARAREVPRWVVGRAFGTTHLELYPARTGRYPYTSLASVLRHEVAHLALADAAGDRRLPRWFHEGVATSIEGGWHGFDHVRLALAALATPRIDDIHSLFAGRQQEDSALAYLLAATVIDDLRARQGPDVPGAIARRVADGVAFDQAFHEMTGDTPDQASARAWQAFRWYTPLLASWASGTAVWLLMIALAALAFAARRARRARQRARWEAEELMHLLEHRVEHEHTGEPHDGDDGFHHGPRSQGLGHGEVEVLLDDPEAAIVDVRQRETAGPDAEDEQVGVDALAPHERADEAGRRERGDGGRTDADSHEHRHAPREHERRRRE
jgi:hypothetical protein